MANSKKYVSLNKLQTFLDNLKTTFASLSHKHTISDITDYTVDTQLSPTSTNPVQNKVLDAEFDAVSQGMNALELAIDGKASSSHNHDDRYYTETEVDTKLSGKANSSHSHAISDVSGLQTALDGKASTSHGTHVSYSTTAPVMDGTASVGTAATVARSDHKHPTDTSRASKTEFDTHNSDTTKHITSTERTNWNAAKTHADSTHARTDATKVEDSTTNGNIKINGTETNVYSHPNSGVTAGTYKSVTVNAQGHITSGSNPTTLSGYGITDAETKTDATSKLTEAKTYADTAATTAANKVKNDLLNGAGGAYDTLKELGDLIDDNVDAIEALEAVATGKADKTHTHAISDVSGLQSALDGKVDSLSDLGITATATELNYMDGVTSNVQTQLSGKAASSHNHSASNIISGILTVARGGTGNSNGYIQAGALSGSTIGALATAEGRNTTASGSYCHAEGNYTEATGSSSHAEGQNTTASGVASHAEGENTTASGSYSHAEGENTIASSKHQHVQGKFNKEDSAGTYAHILGNGTGASSSSRSNAHTIDWDGNGWFAGDIYVGGTSQNDTAASKVITEADQEWNLLYDSGEISAIVNSISNIDVSGYTNIQVLVRIYNDGGSINSRAGSAIFTCENGKTYQFPVWSNMFSKSINTVYTMATFNLVNGWLICPCASRLIGDATTFEDEGGTAGNLSLTGSGMMKCTSPLSTLAVSSLDQNSNYYFGIGSRVMVWGWNA